ncbi:MAG: methyl-accepting chemotaxis protein [Bacilli bacterium]
MNIALDTLIDLLPTLSEALMGSVILAVTDCEKFLAYIPARDLDVGIKAMDSLSPEGSTFQAIAGGRKIIAEIEATAHGVPYIAATIPIFDGGRVVGSFATAYPLYRERELRDMSRQSAGAMQRVTEAVDNLVALTKTLTENAGTLTEVAARTSETAAQADGMAAFIKQVADSTHLLGLNAAIESAHAGEYGRGFSVVASEIRKMAASNKEAAKSITAFVRGLQSSIGNVASRAEELGAVSQELSASLEEMVATAHDLQTLANRLAQLSEVNSEGLTGETFAW